MTNTLGISMNKGYQFPQLYVPSTVMDLGDFYLYVFYTDAGTHAVLICKQDNSIFFEVSCSSGKGGLGWVPVGKAMSIHHDLIEIIRSRYEILTTEFKTLTTTDAKEFMTTLVARIDKAFVDLIEQYDIVYTGEDVKPNTASWVVL